uniref:Ribosomal protein S19 n=7 Tax=Ulmus TaxID=24735 RepID=A0A8F0FKS6_9ROSA|nr:ribosomal protein S19 [Ulmus changii]QWK48973.1 ribosomal protein S19 [Ulmus davidiana]QWK49060.1 ribosomal protein S19 [Ulmus densa]QWK49493.1 ribosomal protein S19 [Ulmus laciniata]QWK49667.1 ribosomal protein S19 [Ulmus lamellosa]QWK49928.1 ribosomal protein S19 [Ulmus microcarpa]QWK50273.1 ribosomal protein S19 [Ulmus pumila]
MPRSLKKNPFIE